MFLVLSLLFIVLENMVSSTTEYNTVSGATEYNTVSGATGYNTVSGTTEYNSRSEDPGKFGNMYALFASVYNVLFYLFSL